MPQAENYALQIIQYTGTDTVDYKRGYFYRSEPVVESGVVSYVWQQIDTQPSNRNYNDLNNRPTINGVTLENNKTSDNLGLQNKLQYSSLPLASSANLGEIVQYIGATTQDYIRGYFYQCRYDSDNDVYSWVQIDTSANAAQQAAITQLETNQGNIASLEVGGVSDLVAAINKINSKSIQRYEYVEPNLIIYYHDGTTFQIAISSILNETQIGELENVIDNTITDGQILQYDSSLQKYKPYAILVALQTLLQDSKDYTDQQITSAVQAGAYVCDEKPTLYHDTQTGTYSVIYKQNGTVKTTTNTEARFYYETNSDPFCTSWIDGTEFTFSVASVNFEDYVNKNTDVVNTYAEDMLDKSKIPDIAALDALLTIVKTSLALKVNTSDIIDNLTSQDATKPLSAKQGKTLKDITDAKSDKLQYTTLPTPDILYEGAVYQFIGTTVQAYTKGNWYECKSNGETPATYYWEAVKMQSVTDNALSAVSENPVQNKIINTALGTKQNINLTNSISIDGNVETTVEGAIEELNTYSILIDTYVGNINALIPSTATTQNKLATAGDIPGIATINDAGIVKPDGSSIFIDANGVISAASATPIDSVVNGNMSAVTSNAVYGATNTLEINKQNKTLASPLTINQVQQTTVEGALGGLNTYTDNVKGFASTVNDKVEAINAVIPSTATSSNKLVTTNDLEKYSLIYGTSYVPAFYVIIADSNNGIIEFEQIIRDNREPNNIVSVKGLWDIEKETFINENYGNSTIEVSIITDSITNKKALKFVYGWVEGDGKNYKFTKAKGYNGAVIYDIVAR